MNAVLQNHMASIQFLRFNLSRFHNNWQKGLKNITFLLHGRQVDDFTFRSVMEDQASEVMEGNKDIKDVYMPAEEVYNEEQEWVNESYGVDLPTSIGTNTCLETEPIKF
ncbi:hypothetical protein ACH5RR_000962 [Cinchona calisaya]|uniref:Uncharacterized protein n=1 Tax=Cinchona calisaya TaxID=153742 RepID=A0ABD3B2F2_9GENT